MTPAPSRTPTPTRPPTPPPDAGAWPHRTDREIAQTLFADDGRVVVVELDETANQSYVVVLGADGRPIDGWPWSIKTGNPIADAELGPDGSLYVAVRGETNGALPFTWALHRLDRDGQELQGFPVDLPPVSYCDLQASPDGIAYETCETEDDNGEATGTVLIAVRPDGSSAFTAPVTFPGSATLLGFGPSNLPIVAIDGTTRTVIRALTAHGGTRWSTAAIPGDAWLDPQGGVRITRHRFQPDACGAPIRTAYDAIGPDGRRPTGWPLVVNGWASGPAVLADGSMVVVTESGTAIRYTRTGTVAAGWPIRGIDVSYGCGGGTTPETDGNRIVIVGGQRVTVLERSGRVAAGWPADPLGSNAIDCPFCTPGSSAPVGPVLAPGGTTYVSTYDFRQRPRVAVIAADGTITAQEIVGARGDEAMWLAGAPTGRVWAVSSREQEDGTTGSVWLVGEGASPVP